MTKHVMPRVLLASLSAAVAPAALVGAVRMDAFDPAKVEQLLKDVQAETQRIGDAVKKTAETALNEAKQAGAVSAEVKAAADKLLPAQAALDKAVKELTEKMEQLETKNGDLEQKLQARRRGTGGADPDQRSLGTLVVDSDAYKNFVKAGSKGTMQIGVQNAITSAIGSAGGLIWSDRETEIVGLPRRQMTIRQLLSVGRTGSNMVEYARMTTRTNNAATVSEGAQKPQSNYVWTKADAPVRTIAHWIHVSRQAMDDAAQLQSEIDTELRYGLDLAEENQILKGDGTGENLEGLVTAATAFTPAFSVDNETAIDQLRLAILQASLAEYAADGIVLNPTDWARIELTKDGEQRYIFANVMQLAGPQMWGRPVVATQAMDVAEFLVGAFKMAAKIYDRLDAEVAISSEDRDNFIKNMLTVRAEKRLALAIKRELALVTGELQYGSGA